MTKIKDYIYLDQRLLNSILAQFGEGLIIGSSVGEETTDKSGEEAGSDTEYGFEGFFGFGVKATNKLKDNNIKEFSNTQQKVIDSALDDYAIDMLIELLEKDDVLVESAQETEEGNYINSESVFKVYDFEILEQSTGAPIVGVMEAPEVAALEVELRQLKESNKNNSTGKIKAQIRKLDDEIYSKRTEIASSIQVFDTMNRFASLGKSLFPESILIKITGAVAYCNNEYFRVNKAQLSTLNDSSRKLKVFGIVSAIKKEVHPTGDFDELDSSSFNQIPTMLTDVVMSSFGILQNEDRIIKPIAIYFE